MSDFYDDDAYTHAFYNDDDLMEMGDREAWEDAMSEMDDFRDDEDDPEDFDYEMEDFGIGDDYSDADTTGDPVFDFDYEPEDE